MGEILKGVIVLSTISATPASFAMAAIFLISGSRIFGFPTLSKKIILVFSLIAWVIFSNSSTSKKDVLTPKRLIVSLKNE